MSSTRCLSLTLLRARASRGASRGFSSTTTRASGSSGSAWTPVLKPGVLPAYDEALSYLSSHASSVRERIRALDSSSLSAEDKATVGESLEVAERINDPATLARFAASDATTYDAADPVLRHLRERVWRNDSGVLDKLMQRATLMHVLPDVLAEITPTADVQLAFGSGSGYTDHSSQGGDVLAGVFVPVHASMQPPKVAVNVFHKEDRLYTLVLVDPDHPNQETQAFTTRLLALKTNITLSATSPHVDLTSDMTLDYIPPHPQHGTGYHRYTLVLLEQPSPLQVQLAHRDAFSLTEFARIHSLVPAGIHFWRAKWDKHAADAVSKIYTDILKTNEPRYTRPPTLDKVRKQIGDIGSKWF